MVIQLMHQDSTSPAHSSRQQTESLEAVQEPTPESRYSDDNSIQSRPNEQHASPDLGQMKLTDREPSYVGSAHWESILAGIGELKAALGAERHSPSPPPNDGLSNDPDPLIVLGRPKVTREYLLKSCPPRKVSDQLLCSWFNCTTPMAPAIHKPTFLAEYARFLQDSSKTPTMWLALYFAVLSLGCEASMFERRTDEECAINKKQAHHYRSLVNEALIIAGELSGGGAVRLSHPILHNNEIITRFLTYADVTRPQRYLAETMIMYMASLHMCGPEVSEHRVWILAGIMLRLCLRMGYHRDPSNYPALTPFECEMRRRVWHQMHIFDILLSFSIGLPDMIRQVQSDTQLPRNLADSDFGPESRELPPSRPSTELMPVTFAIVKAELAKVFGRAAEISHAIQFPDRHEVQALDEELERIYTRIPDGLNFNVLHQSLIESPSVNFHRFKLQLLYQKTRCVLYRRYITDKCSDPDEEPFRVKCVDAAMHILVHLETVYVASQEGGQLSSAPYLLGTFGVHDFLLATMILCLELTKLRKSPASQKAQTQQRITTMKGLLETTYNIYSKPMKRSHVPAKAVKALELMLNKAREPGQWWKTSFLFSCCDIG